MQIVGIFKKEVLPWLSVLGLAATSIETFSHFFVLADWAESITTGWRLLVEKAWGYLFSWAGGAKLSPKNSSVLTSIFFILSLSLTSTVWFARLFQSRESIEKENAGFSIIFTNIYVGIIPLYFALASLSIGHSGDEEFSVMDIYFASFVIVYTMTFQLSFYYIHAQIRSRVTRILLIIVLFYTLNFASTFDGTLRSLIVVPEGTPVSHVWPNTHDMPTLKWLGFWLCLTSVYLFTVLGLLRFSRNPRVELFDLGVRLALIALSILGAYYLVS